ncbi:MAG TPA: hypothetical protein VN880_11310, partial [Solirubrobacteraceae bacterium]|nr:hypothetical protein [Solirubrobacteraceae bacterium]
MTAAHADAPAPAPTPPAEPESESGSPGREVEPLTALGESFKAAMGAVRRLRGRETQQIGRFSYAQYSLLFGLAAKPELSAS